jgi:hypothetical protein
MAYEYRYGLARRPAGVGCVPGNKPYRLEPQLQDAEGRRLTLHGVIIYERPLTVDELYAFDLALLADDDLKSALATEIALELADGNIEFESIPSEYPDDFCALVSNILGKIRLYRVYVGDLASFSKMVLGRLEAIRDKSLSDDAEMATILHEKKYWRQQAAL